MAGARHWRSTVELNDAGIVAALTAAIAKAQAMGVAQCIVLVDPAGTPLAAFRMAGAKFLSLRTARRKAITAASSRAASGEIGGDMGGTVAQRLATATDGDFTALAGGLPIFVSGHIVGAIGVGSGSADEDLIVARAGIAAIEGASETG